MVNQKISRLGIHSVSQPQRDLVLAGNTGRWAGEGNFYSKTLGGPKLPLI